MYQPEVRQNASASSRSQPPQPLLKMDFAKYAPPSHLGISSDISNGMEPHERPLGHSVRQQFRLFPSNTDRDRSRTTFQHLTPQNLYGFVDHYHIGRALGPGS